MEIKVVVADAAHAKMLVQRLAGVLEATSVSLDADSNSVSVRAIGETRDTLPNVLRTVGDWLDETALEVATVWLGGRSHVLVRGDYQIASVG